MDIKMYEEIRILNEYLIKEINFMTIIESKKIEEKEILKKMIIKVDGVLLSNSELVSEINKECIIINQRDMIKEFFKSTIKYFKKNKYNLLILLNTENITLCSGRNEKEIIDFYKFLSNRRKHNLSIIILVSKKEELPKSIRDSSDFIINMDNKRAILL